MSDIKSSITKKFLAIRKNPEDGSPSTGSWYSGFSGMKKFAVGAGVPFIAVWTNGDACPHCVELEKIFIQKTMLEWFASSGYAMWAGCGSDTSADDKPRGKGFNWCWNKGKLQFYPMVRLYWKAPGGKTVDVSLDGDALRGGKTGKAGVSHVKAVLSDAFAGYCPASLKIRTNPEWTAAQIAGFREKIKENGGHCPCQAPSDDTICMCRFFREQRTAGVCGCGLYEKYSS